MPIQCPSCGKLTSEKNLLCTYCSKPLMPPVACKSCGREVPANRTQCLYCGTPVPKEICPRHCLFNQWLLPNLWSVRPR